MSSSEKIGRDDIKAKLTEIQSDATDTVVDAKRELLAAGVAIGAVILIAVFVLGRRGGRRKSTVIEVRRA
jgi:hypothetical protein